MYGADWDEGCPSCSFWADGFNGIDVHLAQRDTAFTAVSVAPLDKLVAYQERMGWSFPWVSSAPSSFNADFNVSFEPPPNPSGTEYNFIPLAESEEGGERPGLSAFVMGDGPNADTIFHTYSCYGRCLDTFNPAYRLLDLTTKGRDEDDLPWPMAWLQRHDQYDD